MSKKLSTAQIRVLQYLAQDGAYIMRWRGARSTQFQMLIGDKASKRDKIRYDTWYFLFKGATSRLMNKTGVVKPTR